MADASDTPSTSLALLERGQAFEAAGRPDLAIADYDQVIAVFRRRPHNSLDLEQRRLLGVAWMNRGNVLQRTAARDQLARAVDAYDAAIQVFLTLPLEAEPRLRNHLGAAWLNRGHALITLGNAGASASFEQAISELEKLPLETDESFRLNLSGAWTNLAHTLLGPPEISARERSRDAARKALRLLETVEREHPLFAAMSLRARRALVMATADLLAHENQFAALRVSAGTSPGNATLELASEATDAIEEGLAIARSFEERGDSQLRPLAERLFRLGAQLYANHQPQFLAEFVLEVTATASLARDEAFLSIAADAVTGALERLQTAPLNVASNREAEKLITTARALRAAQDHLSAVISHRAPAPTLT